jgi:hypothetical protein
MKKLICLFGILFLITEIPVYAYFSGTHAAIICSTAAASSAARRRRALNSLNVCLDNGGGIACHQKICEQYKGGVACRYKHCLKYGGGNACYNKYTTRKR